MGTQYINRNTKSFKGVLQKIVSVIAKDHGLSCWIGMWDFRNSLSQHGNDFFWPKYQRSSFSGRKSKHFFYSKVLDFFKRNSEKHSEKITSFKMSTHKTLSMDRVLCEKIFLLRSLDLWDPFLLALHRL